MFATRKALAFSACTLLMAMTCRSQQPACYPPGYQIQTPPQRDPTVYGQWAGPYDFETVMTDSGNHLTKEIAHAWLIPPNADGSSHHAGKILFLNRAVFGAGINYEPKSFLWNPSAARPGSSLVVVPGPWHAAYDPFCCGMGHLADGTPIAAGGHDLVTSQSAGVAIGTYRLHRLRTDTTPLPTWELLSTSLQRARFYPSLVETSAGGWSVLGDTNGQALTPATPEIRETLDVTGNWASAVNNVDYKDHLQVACSSTLVLRWIHDYPKVFLLSDGILFHADDFSGTPSVLRSEFLPTLIENCATSSTDKFRWEQGLATSFPFKFFGGNAVHFVHRAGGNLHDLVYLLGGTVMGEDDQPCSLDAQSRVVCITDPNTAAAWDDAAVDDLVAPRTNSTTIVLLDGSMLVVGGTAVCQGTCVGARVPELLKPNAIFGTSGTETWSYMDEEPRWRSYHSVAVLLPDGRVISAGGQAVGGEYTVDIFSPPYLFWGPAPEILNPPGLGTVQAYGGLLELNVQLRSGASIARAAILRPGAATHATDMQQRYVALQMGLVTYSSGTASFQVSWPANSLEAPPGWYMLTVVDSFGVPSIAKWVRFAAP